MGRGEPCRMTLRKISVTPPVEMVVAWCGLGAGEGGAGEKKLGYIIFPVLVFFGENVIKIYQKVVTQQTNSNVT